MALGILGPVSDSSVPRLLIIAKEGRDRDRIIAIAALGDIVVPSSAHAPEVIEFLNTIKDDKNKNVRDMAKKSLKVIQSK